MVALWQTAKNHWFIYLIQLILKRDLKLCAKTRVNMYLCIFFFKKQMINSFHSTLKTFLSGLMIKFPSPSSTSDSYEFSQTSEKLGHLWPTENFCSQIKLQDCCLQFPPAFYSILFYIVLEIFSYFHCFIGLFILIFQS